MGNPLPTADQAFGPAPAGKPTAAQAFGPEQTDAPASGSFFDTYYSNPAKAETRILDAFGQGAKTAWGAEPLGLTPDSEAWMRKVGLFNDYSAGQNNIFKSLNEALIRPAAAGLDLLNRSVQSGIEAAASGTYQAGIEAGFSEEGAKVIPQIIGYETQRGDILSEPVPHVAPPVNLTRARALKVVGEGEGGYFGTVEPAPDTAAAHAEAIKADNAEMALEAKPSGEALEPAIAAPEPRPPTVTDQPDIHDVARQISPETFQQYDALSIRRDTYRQWIGELRDAKAQSPQATELQTQIDTILGKVNGVEDRLTKTGAAKLDNARAALDDYMRADSGDMAFVRKNLQAVDYQMRDLAPSVSEAYRKAQDQMPAQEVPAVEKPALAEGEVQGVKLYRGVGPNAKPSDLGGAFMSPDRGVAETYAGAKGTVTEHNVTFNNLLDAHNWIAAKQKLGLEPSATMKDLIGAAKAQGYDGLKFRTLNGDEYVSIPNDGGGELKNTPEPAHRGPANENIVSNIADDVQSKLVAAGRPEDEAQAAAAIVQSHYEARAARFGGDKGTAEELYSAEGPQIKGSDGTSKRGSLAIKNARSTIRLFKNADASTFMHETGHQWLEELISDASEAQAPNELKADAATVREWLGAQAGEAIPTRAHEKFARGFERYLMEGVAPSQKLAGVFAKFKGWLTQIYQTVQKLRSPITDDIRQVFDRLVATPDKPAIIAPERPVEKTMADIHEADAESTPPEKASQVADNVRAEIDTTALKVAPEVHDELPGKIQTGGIEGEDSGSPGGGNASGSGPGEGRSLETVGAESAGGNEAQAESTIVRRAGKPRPAADNAGPDARFADAESQYVDKAGNIRLDNINTTADVDQYIRQASDENNGFIGARRGVVSDQEVLDLASSMGLRPEDLDVAKLRAEFSPEKVVAVRKLFVQSATDAHGLSEKAALGGEADVMAYAEARSRLRMVHEYLAAVTAETGRTLRAFRKMEGTDHAKGIVELMGDLAQDKTLYQLKQEAGRVSKLDSASKVSGFLHDSDKPGLGAMALEMFQNWLISGPLTHLGYSVGNTVLALYKAVPETLAEAGFGVLKEKFTGTKQERVYAGEAAAQLYALFRGQRNGFQAAYDAFMSGQTTALPGEVDAINSGRSEDKKVSTPFTQGKAIPDFEVGGVRIPLGTAIRIPGERMVAPIHSYFRSLGYAQAIARLAYRRAIVEGLSGTKFDARIADLTVHPTPDMMENARNEATEQTLMGRGGDLTQRVSQFVNWNPKIIGLGPTKPLRFIDPFVHIASNIVEQSVIERGPLGILSNKVRQDLKGENGNIAQANAAARMAVGTALSIVGGGLAMEGLITPSAPSDPHEAAIWRMTNGMPHSARFGDMSFDLSRMGVLGFQLGIAADLYHFTDSIGKIDSAKLASLLVHSFTQNFLDEGFMRGPSDLIKALNDPDRYGGNWVKNFAASIATPYSVGMSQIAREVDPYSREARTTLDSIIDKIPFASESLLARRDIWGEPVPNREWLGTYSQHVQTDAATMAVMSVGQQTGWFPAPVDRKIRGVQLTDQQFDDYSRIAGRMARMRLTPIVSSPSFDQMPAEVKLDIVKNAFVGSRETARSLIMMKNPDIVQAALKAKQAPLSATIH